VDAKGRILVIEDDRIVHCSSEPVPDRGRGHLVLAALDTAPGGGDCGAWWPEMAPLTREEREYVRTQLRRAVTVEAPRPAREGGERT
jgi:hypothetical protein